jgi:hypothetical protein
VRERVCVCVCGWMRKENSGERANYIDGEEVGERALVGTHCVARPDAWRCGCGEVSRLPIHRPDPGSTFPGF